MKLKRLLSLAMALCMLMLMCVGCGGGTTDPTAPIDIDTGKTYTLTIYRARDSGMTDGERDEAVKAAADAQWDGEVQYIVEREASYKEPEDRLGCLAEDAAWLLKNL